MADYLDIPFNPDSDELTEVFDELPFWSAPFGLKLLDKIKIRKNITAVDIGFGAGFPLIEIAARLGASSKVIGIDPWAAGIRRTRKKIAFYGVKNIEIIKGVAENMPIDNNSVDLIVSNNGMNNVADLNKALSECARILKSGGQFVMTMNTDASMIEFYSVMENVLNDHKMHNSVIQMKEHIRKKRKPLDEILALVKNHGLQVNDVEHSGFEYRFADGTTIFNHHFIRLAFLDGWKNNTPADKQGEIFAEIEKRINIQSEYNGFFKLSVPFVVIDLQKK